MRAYDVVIIGAGGAGLMCARYAGNRGRRVCVLDHSSIIGRKILISGGGRCNFTNVHVTPVAYVSKNPHFCKSALARFTPDDFIDLVKRYGIRFHEKKHGQLFCDGSARNIVDMLVQECAKANVDIHPNSRILQIQKDTVFTISTPSSRYVAQSLVIATGGLSYPKIGASGLGYDVARQFGISIVPPAPALVGVTFHPQEKKEFERLAGVAVEARVTCSSASFHENILFTHTGLSGPAILQASLYWTDGEPIFIDLLPQEDLVPTLTEMKNSGSQAELKSALAAYLPQRLSEVWCARSHGHAPVWRLTDTDIRAINAALHEWKVIPSGTDGYRKAEVTRGGVDTSALSSKTMQATNVEGLYFIGEVVDVTGQLGGYNFQWAWASGAAAGQYA